MVENPVYAVRQNFAHRTVLHIHRLSVSNKIQEKNRYDGGSDRQTSLPMFIADIGSERVFSVMQDVA